MLYLVDTEKARTRAELNAQARHAFDFSDNPTLRELGLAELPRASEMAEQGVADLFERGWLAGEERLAVTDAGREHLRQQMARTRGHTHRLIDTDGRHIGAHRARHRR